jgi:hypothetical protein
MANAGGSDVVKEVTGKVQGLYDAYPYPPEAVFDGVTVGYNHRWSWTHAWAAIHGEVCLSSDFRPPFSCACRCRWVLSFRRL